LASEGEWKGAGWEGAGVNPSTKEGNDERESRGVSAGDMEVEGNRFVALGALQLRPAVAKDRA
jgi:hypothetical protein